MRRAIARLGERIAVGLDVRGTTLAARGWTKEGGELFDVLARLDADGCARYVVTDVRRDGTLTGPNVELLRDVCAATDQPVIASGGVSTLEDLRGDRAWSPWGRGGDRRQGAVRRGVHASGSPGGHPMTVAVRVIPCLDVDAGRVVKGVNFLSLRDAGDPVEMARVYDAEGADELVFLDITASSGTGRATYEVVRQTAEQVFIPLTVGGGVRAGRRRSAAAVRRGQGRDQHCRDCAPGTLTECARAVRHPVRGASQATPAGAPSTPSGFEVSTHGGRQGTGLDAVEWAERGAVLGAGEILLNSMDADGTTAGYDLEMVRAVRAVVDVPLIASGGAGSVGDFGRQSTPAPTPCSPPAFSTSACSGSPT